LAILTFNFKRIFFKIFNELPGIKICKKEYLCFNHASAVKDKIEILKACHDPNEVFGPILTKLSKFNKVSQNCKKKRAHGYKRTN